MHVRLKLLVLQTRKHSVSIPHKLNHELGLTLSHTPSFVHFRMTMSSFFEPITYSPILCSRPSTTMVLTPFSSVYSLLRVFAICSILYSVRNFYVTLYPLIPFFVSFVSFSLPLLHPFLYFWFVQFYDSLSCMNICVFLISFSVFVAYI